MRCIRQFAVSSLLALAAVAATPGTSTAATPGTSAAATPGTSAAATPGTSTAATPGASTAATPRTSPAARRCAGADQLPASVGSARATRATLCLLNQQRAARGLKPLRLDGKLTRAARRHARDMVVKRYFAHDSRSGATFATRIARTGWTRARRTYTVGENIGWGGGTQSTPAAMVEGWMNSAGHRANILSRSFRLIGIGIANGCPKGGAGATYATDFGG